MTRLSMVLRGEQSDDMGGFDGPFLPHHHSVQVEAKRMDGVPMSCPVCRSLFSEGITCTNCGTSPASLRDLEARAAHWRSEASACLERQQFEAAEKAALEAQRLCHTQAGRVLELVERVLKQ